MEIPTRVNLMLSKHDNEVLTKTGPDTPMGNLFRRFWMPVLLISELDERDGDPVRVKILGEELVAFRDSSGAVGLIDSRCPHRQAELFWGRNEEEGLRCVYHGWKFDREGSCLDMPSELPGSQFKDKVSITAYPTREWGGFIWAFMGPKELISNLPEFEFAKVPQDNFFVSKKLQECNWAQSLEGAIDTAHFSFLHMLLELPDDAPAAWHYMKADGAPRFTILPTEAGFLIGGARKAGNLESYWRITQFLLPNHSLAPGAERGQNMNGQTWVPIDDESCWIFCYTWNPDRPITDEEIDVMRSGGSSIHTMTDDNFRPLANTDNDYFIDREAQRKTSFTGISGIANQDTYIQNSQGVIYDRTKEHLGSSDQAILEFRKMMLQKVRYLLEGEEPIEAQNSEAYFVQSGAEIAPREWELKEVTEKRFRRE